MNLNSMEKLESKNRKEKTLEYWLSQHKPETAHEYIKNVQFFLDWAKTSDVELVNSYKKAKDKNSWRKEVGKILIEYQNEMVSSGKFKVHKR